MSVEFAFWSLFFVILGYGFLLYIAVGILIQGIKDEIIDEIREEIWGGEQQ